MAANHEDNAELQRFRARGLIPRRGQASTTSTTSTTRTPTPAPSARDRAARIVRDFGVGVRAFDPVTAGGARARAEVRATLDRARGEGRNVAATVGEILGPPTSRAGAVAGLALAPLGAAGGRLASNAIIRGGLARTTAAQTLLTIPRRQTVRQLGTRLLDAGRRVARSRAGKAAGIAGGVVLGAAAADRIVDGFREGGADGGGGAIDPGQGAPNDNDRGGNGDGRIGDGGPMDYYPYDEIADASTGLFGAFGGLDTGLGVAAAEVGQGVGRAATPALVVLAVAAAASIAIPALAGATGKKGGKK